MNLMHIKLRTGEELVAEVIEESEDTEVKYFLLRNPVHLTPSAGGVSAREWLYFSGTNEVWINTQDIIYANSANEDAFDFYEKVNFLRQDSYPSKHLDDDFDSYDFSDPTQEEFDDSVNEMRKMLDIIFESKNSTRH